MMLLHSLRHLTFQLLLKKILTLNEKYHIHVQYYHNH